VGGRTDRAFLVLHHALTGRAGAGKATGFDRSSFGRNSKVLHGWTRAQMNLAPGIADNSNVLVVASGKNNDFPEFAPFAIELDPQTMTYKVKPDFDMQAWQDEITGAKRGIKDASESDILKVLADAGGRMEKKKLIERAVSTTGRGVQHIREVIAQMLADHALRESKEPRAGKPPAVFIEPLSLLNDDDEM